MRLIVAPPRAVGARHSRPRRRLLPPERTEEGGPLDRLSGATDFAVAEVPLRALGFAAGRPADLGPLPRLPPARG
jgi:hypothetical protein